MLPSEVDAARSWPPSFGLVDVVILCGGIVADVVVGDALLVVDVLDGSLVVVVAVALERRPRSPPLSSRARSKWNWRAKWEPFRLSRRRCGPSPFVGCSPGSLCPRRWRSSRSRHELLLLAVCLLLDVVCPRSYRLRHDVNGCLLFNRQGWNDSYILCELAFISTGKGRGGK